jgi:hypothetical protein
MLKLREVLPYIAPIVVGGFMTVSPTLRISDTGDLRYVGRYDDIKVDYTIYWMIRRTPDGRIKDRDLLFERWVFRGERKTYDDILLRIFNEHTSKPHTTVEWVLCWKGATMSDGSVEVSPSDAVKWYDEILKDVTKIFNNTRDVEECFKKYAEKLVREGKVPSKIGDLYIKSLHDPRIPLETVLT